MPSVVSYESMPESVVPWSASMAISRIKEWSRGESIQSYRAFAYVFDDDTCGFCHHDIEDGILVVNRDGLVESMESLVRGDVNFPRESLRRSVYNHLKRHYHDLAMEVPELPTRSYEMESRFFNTDVAPVTLEKRSEGLPTITGYGAVFYRAGSPGTEFRFPAPFDGIVERIDRSAFDPVLAKREPVLGLYDHRGVPLGRFPGTMRLSVDDIGLRYEIDPPDEPHARAVITAIERRDVQGSSFSFLVRGEDGEKWEREGDTDIRWLRSVEIGDTGPVSRPAYAGTSADVSRFKPIAENRDKWAATLPSPKPENVGPVLSRSALLAAKARVASL